MSDIREATFDDYEEIMELMQRFEIPYKTKKEWKGIWEYNPMIADDHISWTIGWVVVNDEGRVVGYLGNIPLVYELNGKRLIAAVAHAWVVDEEFRKYSVLLINSYFNQRNVDMLLNTTGGNSVTIKIFSAYKAKRAPVDQYDVARFCVTNYKGFLTALLKKKEFLCIILLSHLYHLQCGVLIN